MTSRSNPAASPSRTDVPVVSAASHARRRSRDHESGVSVAEAKQQFMSTVDDAVNNLIQTCGYSRSRAVSALLHEIRHDIPSPSDEEVFRTMKTYGLGMEEATRALIVSSTVLKILRETSGSFVDAIDGLTERLSTTNLKSTKESVDDAIERPRSPDRRIESISALERSSSIPRHSQSTSKKGKVASKSSKSKPSSKQMSPKLSTAPKPSRKRSIDEASQTEKKLVLRNRSDSVSEDVEAKVALNCKEDDVNIQEASSTLRPSSQTTVGRAKRAPRVDDSSCHPSALKRARTSET